MSNLKVGKTLVDYANGLLGYLVLLRITEGKK